MRLCAFEDYKATTLEPLTLTRPVGDLRCGALTLFERQQRYFDAYVGRLHVRSELAALAEQRHPNFRVNECRPERAGPLVIVNARWLPPSVSAAKLEIPSVGILDGEIIYAALGSPEAREGLLLHETPLRPDWADSLPVYLPGGALIEHPWDLISLNADCLEQDYWHWKDLHEQRSDWDGVSVIGPQERLCVSPTAVVEPAVVIDTTRGPVLIDDGVIVGAFSRLAGPCYVGPGTRLMAAQVKGSAIGPNCRIGGEVEDSIFQGFANKAHDGFIGHSCVGEWVNLGAGTQISDLRNDYRPITMTVHGRKIDTGLTKIGAFIGDHTKTSVHASFNTGTFVGAFCQMLKSDRLSPRMIPSFHCYDHNGLRPLDDLEKLKRTAVTVMGRRNQEWTQAHDELFTFLYEREMGESSREVAGRLVVSGS